ncbi:acyl-CoA dehydrogenase/oxidase [Aspergillus heterothallicus]
MLAKLPDLPLDGAFWRPPSESLELAQYPILSSTYACAHPYEAIKSHYEQVKAICKAHALTVEDILTLSPKFWTLHADPVSARMSAAFILIGSQYNLVVGKIAPYGKRRPDLLPLLQRLMTFDVSGIYMLTEPGHGLDARNLQTTATLLPDGGFDLHTPTPDAAKSMSVATPISGLEKVAIVFARLQIDGENHGIRGFIVTPNDVKRMTPGITARLLPNRAGAHYLDHAITTFNHVYLPKESLLGEITPTRPRSDEQEDPHRDTLCIPALKAGPWIAARYAMKCTVEWDISSSPAANRLLLPHCQTLVEAIGHRMACEAAAAAEIDPLLLKLYEIGVVKSDLACYVEHGLISRTKVGEVEDSCITELMKGKIWELLADMDADVGAFCDAPMLSTERWEEFMGTLDTFGGGDKVVA